MAKDFLNGFYIDTTGEHHGRRSVAQLMGRKLGAVQPGL